MLATMFEGRELSCIRGERLIFAGLSFRLRPGEALLVTGRNGAGKSSLLRLMAGLLPTFAGQLLWNGMALSDPEPFRADMRYLGHLDAVKPALTVEENLSFWSALHPSSTTARASADALAEVGLAPLSDLPARFLSAGQRRRLALARLFVAPGRLWLLDEPTVALDQTSVRAVARAISRHRSYGGMAVVSTNVALDLPEAQQLDMDAHAAQAAG